MTVDEALSRGVANIIPSKEELKKRLQAKKLNIYLGIDPTSTKIHLGHAVVLRKLQHFAELGHNVTLVIGDYTALIGDTSDKESERPALSEKEIVENFHTYKKQAEKIVDFSKVNIRNNSEWLKKLDFKKILELTMQFSLGDFISRELIKKRINEGKRVGLHEVLYPVAQGYDSYMLDTDLQIGGTDQTFNIQAGRILSKKWKNKESFVLTTPILEGPDGRKMSKSLGNAIWLTDEAEDMYTKIMAINDELIDEYFTLATSISLEEIKNIVKEAKEGKALSAKKRLAFEIVKELHTEKRAKEAEEAFAKNVQRKETPENIETKTVKSISALDVLVEIGFAESKSDAKRLIEQGGVSVDGEVLKDENEKIASARKRLIKVGKRRFVNITS